MATRTVKFDDWSGGHYGVLDPRNAARNQFYGTNVRVYEDGLIGPRPGLKKTTNTSDANGYCWGLHYQPISGKEGLSVVGDTVYRIAQSGTAFTFTSVGTIAAAPTDTPRFDYYDSSTAIFMVSPDDKAYVINLTAGSVTAITNSPGGRSLRLWRDRLYIGGDPGSNPWRVYYSDAAAFTTIQTTNYFDVDYWYEAYTLQKIRDRLMFGLQGDGWWTLTGAPATGTLRQVMTSSAPDKDRACVKDNLDRVWYMPQQADRGLMVTNGSTWEANEYGHLRLTDGGAHGAFSFGHSDILFVTPETDTPMCLWRGNDVWARQEFSVDLDGPITRWESDKFLLVGGSSAGSKASYYFLDCDLSRPGFTTDTYAGPGDNSATPLTADFDTAEVWDDKGHQVHPIKVTVDFIAYCWDDDGGGNAKMRVRAQARSMANVTSSTFAGTTLSSGETYLESTGDLSVLGTERRVVFGVGDAYWGGGFLIRFDQLIGVKIKSVVVEFETRA